MKMRKVAICILIGIGAFIIGDAMGNLNLNTPPKIEHCQPSSGTANSNATESEAIDLYTVFYT